MSEHTGPHADDLSELSIEVVPSPGDESYLDSLRIDDMRIATPCTADWAQMTGDARARFCGLCEKNVYNLSAMTRSEITDLIVRTEGEFCGRLYRREDGTMITADCPVGVAEKAKRAARWAWASATVLVLTLLAGVLGVFGSKKVCDLIPEPRFHRMGEMVVEPPPARMGAIAKPPPPPEMGAPKFVRPEMGDVEMPAPSEKLVPLQRRKMMGKVAVPVR